MDISDILQDINSPAVDLDPFRGDEGIAGVGASRGQHPGQVDLQALTRAWINERGTTELLQYVNCSCLSV